MEKQDHAQPIVSWWVTFLHTPQINLVFNKDIIFKYTYLFVDILVEILDLSENQVIEFLCLSNQVNFNQL